MLNRPFSNATLLSRTRARSLNFTSKHQLSLLCGKVTHYRAKLERKCKDHFAAKIVRELGHRMMRMDYTVRTNATITPR